MNEPSNSLENRIQDEPGLELDLVDAIIVGTNVYENGLNGNLLLSREFATEELAEEYVAEKWAWALFDAEISAQFTDHYQEWLRLKAEETGVQASLIHELLGLDVRDLHLPKTHNSDRSLR